MYRNGKDDSIRPLCAGAGCELGEAKDGGPLCAAERAAATDASTLSGLSILLIRFRSTFALSHNQTGPSYSRALEGHLMVKRGAGNGRGHVVLLFPFRTNSTSFALCSIAAGDAGRRATGAVLRTHQENHNQPIARIYKRGVCQASAFLMPAVAGRPLSHPTMLRRLLRSRNRS